MTPELWERVSTALDQLALLPAEQAEDYLQRLASSDAEVAAQVRNLARQGDPQLSERLEQLPAHLRERLQAQEKASPSADEEQLTLNIVAGPRAGQSLSLLGHTTYLVGRGPTGVQLAIEADQGMSRTHFLVEFNPPLARLLDLRSKNGTHVNGERVGESLLRDGDEIRAGTSLFRVGLAAGPPTLTVAGNETTFATRITPETPVPGYQLLEELGRGGMGIVYRGQRLADGQVVAIKTVLPAVAPHPETLGRFQREMKILQRLSHPHIVQFLEAGEAGGLLHFVMEYVAGQSASQVVKHNGPLEVGRVVPLACQLLEALAHAHQQGFVHRDVKPGNLLLARSEGQEMVKLADFGLARTYQASAMSGLTISGQPGGTPGFMPPEQVLDFRTVQPSADQYGAAATLYYLLTGQMIYERPASMADLLVCILRDEPIPLREAGPALPGQLGSVFRRALAREPRQRFPDVLALRDAFRAAV